jgi:signal transduction histidine kinase/ActR/RegA family two-component response regulator
LPALPRRGSEARRAALLADEIPWRICSGQERLVAWRHSVVRDAEGACKYVIYTGIDVTEQRRLEEELQQARKLETLGTLVGGIAHDFNNHLTVILGNLSLGLSDLLALERTGVTIPPSALRELRLQLEQVDAAAQRCADVTRRLLTFSKGRTSPVQPTPLLPLLEEAVAGLRGQTHDSLEVRLESEPGLWAVLGDTSQLQQVLSILVANARDAMPGGGTLTLRACNRTLSEDEPLPHPEAHPGSYVELTVRDTGKGMPPEVRERLFEPFFTTKEIGKGTGMGLAMVYGIVKAHKGWITVESAPEHGSAFTLYFPAAPSLTPVESRASLALTATACVLVVDDEDQVRNLARLILERAGYRVLDAANGEAAVELHAQRASEIDLVLMDYAMPRMNGLEAFQRMRQRTPNLRVIFSSGYTMDVDGEQLLQAGARGFVPKPYRPDALVRLVREVLAGSESG